MNRRTASLLVVFALVTAACPECPGGDDAGPPGEASGTVVLDGVEELYSVDVEASHLVILSKLTDQVGCGVFHAHAVEAKSYSAEFLLDQADPAGSTFTFEVPAQGLVPDLPENRDRFDETRGIEISEGDRGRIKVSVLEELRADEHPLLTFAARDFSTFEGTGTATIDVTLNGITESVPFDYEAALDGEGAITVTGAGRVDGVPHAIPNPDGLFSDCISPDMDLVLELTLVPGGGDGPPPTPDAGPPYEETFFDYVDGCPDTGGFDTVQETFMRRCVGCHQDPPRLAASTPLEVWEDFRVDTPRAVGEPLFLTVEAFIQLPELESLHMPPLDVTQLATDELNAILDWTEAGGPPDSCTPTPLPTFTHTPESLSCGTVGWEEDVEPVLAQYDCQSCHADTQTGIPRLAETVDGSSVLDYQAGLVLSEHPFFQPLNLWESSVERMKDSSMPPGGGAGAGDITILEQWVSEGFPETRCP